MESWQHTAERELREETGLSTGVVAGPAVGINRYQFRGRRKVVNFFVFWCDGDIGPEFHDPEPATRGRRWVSMAELHEINFNSGETVHLLQKALAVKHP